MIPKSGHRFSDKIMRREREAERRKAHPTNVRARANKSAQFAPLICRRGARRGQAGANSRNLSASGRARLPALHCGTRHASRNQHWLSSRTGFPATG